MSPLKPRRYAVHALAAAATMAVAVLGAGFAVRAAVIAYGCLPGTGSCKAAGTLAETFGSLALGPALALWLGVLAWRRTVDWGRPGWVSLPIPVLVLASTGFLAFASGSFASAFVLPGRGFPAALAGALALAALLGFTPSNHSIGHGLNRIAIKSLEWAAAACLLASAAAAIPLALLVMSMFSGMPVPGRTTLVSIAEWGDRALTWTIAPLLVLWAVCAVVYRTSRPTSVAADPDRKAAYDFGEGRVDGSEFASKRSIRKTAIR